MSEQRTQIHEKVSQLIEQIDRLDKFVEDLAVANEVRVWAIATGDNPKLRIALFGYEGEHKMPRSWECVSWRGNVGYNRTNGNRHRERIWFSPHCLKP